MLFRSCEGQKVDHPEGTYDTSLSCNCFEHNPHWAETFQNMWRMTRSGGLVFVAVPTTGSQEHGTHENSPDSSPLTLNIGWNYYKNLEEKDFTDNFNLNEMFDKYFFELCFDNTKDLYFYGFKR